MSVVAFLRTVKTASGARAVQIVHSQRRGSRDIEHIGSAHTDVDLELLKAVARQRMAAGQGELDLRLPDSPANGGAPLAIASMRAGHLLDALGRAYDALGFAAAAEQDEVFKALVLARIIEPTSKLDSLRVLDEAGARAPSYATVKRRLRVYATGGQASVAGETTEDAPVEDGAEPEVDPAGGPWRTRLARAGAEHVRLGPATLLLYDVTTLYFETDEGDGFREPGFSKERRLEPQITVGLLTDGAGFPLMVHAFKGNRAETTTMLPVLRAFLDAHCLSDVTVIADAGMVSEANKRAIAQAGLSFILGARIPEVPYVVTEWRDAHPDAEIPDGHLFVQPWPAGPGDKRRDHTICPWLPLWRSRNSVRWVSPSRLSRCTRQVTNCPRTRCRHGVPPRCCGQPPRRTRSLSPRSSTASTRRAGRGSPRTILVSRASSRNGSPPSWTPVGRS